MTLPLPQIKAAANIVTVISEYLPLKKSGNGLVGKCPFHQEKSGSFRVNPDTQRFKCFGCGASGDVIQFVQDIEHLTMTEAARRLAERFGVEIPDPSKDVKGKQEGISGIPGKSQNPATARRIRSHAEQLSEECAWWVRRTTERLWTRADIVTGMACFCEGAMGLERRAGVWRRIIARWTGIPAGEKYRMYERRRALVVRDYRDDVAWTELLVSELASGEMR